ncbi:MAG: acetate kinase [Candidatus Riflebacteria bacterium]|nr:acetate kinase [Candidatus Riflebacteria bacterium]
MNVFVLNCGSSSLKFQVISTDLDLIKCDGDRLLAKGLIERVGSQALITLQATDKPPVKQATPLRDHRAALGYVLKWIADEETQIPGIKSLEDIAAVGHRVVHGGERFQNSVLLDAPVIAGIEECIDLAPLHNPANLKGISVARELFGPAVPQVAVFDTAFHATIPEVAYLYAIPYQMYRRFKIRKYGFHGTSHRYVAYRYRRLNGLERQGTNIISLHLGNGSSACAIKKGQSIDTSMGMTPLEGLVMGTRCGDIDATIVDFLMDKEGSSIDEVLSLLNKRSGVLGISGLTNDMRELLQEAAEHQDRRALLAVDMFCLRIRKYLGSYLAEMNGADAICFTAGIGENSPEIRKKVCDGLDWLGVKLDDELNTQAVAGTEACVSKPDSRVKVYVIPTNEELLIARDTFRVVAKVPRPW